MKLALECRTDLMEMIQPFADFDFILAKRFLEDEEYANFYRESDRLKFVDNSVKEEGTPVALEELKKVFEEVNGRYIFSPDLLNDCAETIRNYRECIKVIPKERVIGVVQGNTFEEAFSCVVAYEGPIIAVPSTVCSTPADPPYVMGLRRALIVSHIPEGQVFLLGFTGLDELFWYRNNPNVFGMDTDTPIWLGLQGLDILDPLEKKEMPSKTLKEQEKYELTQQAWTAIIRNIALLRRYMS